MASQSGGMGGGGVDHIHFIKLLVLAIIKVFNTFACLFPLQHIFCVNKVKVMKFEHSNQNRTNSFAILCLAGIVGRVLTQLCTD